MHHTDSSEAPRGMAARVLVPAHIDRLAATPPGDGHVAMFDGETMGTTWSVRCVLPPGEDAGQTESRLDATIRAVLDEVIEQMSNWRDDSDVSRFNRAEANTWVTVPRACFDVVEAALAVARESGGAYDPSAGPLVDLWGFGLAPRRADSPSFDEVSAVRARCGWQRIEADRAGLRLYQAGGSALDLCAIAKGYAVDAVRDALVASDIDHVLVEIGGELRGEGVKPDGMPWWVELETPPQEGAFALPPGVDLIALHGLSVATSGDYRRYYVDKTDVRRAHTIDPRTGYPASHALASVTVLHPSCMLADAWSTALTVLGPDAGMLLAQRKRLAARFLVRTPDGFRELTSPAYAAMLE
ncbi:FAD:protein FMN transferase [Paraburkholderia sp. J67]|uniref:FAD:protein FMN transferase n=1 Tax=Paraburkholderia sp. J67 TaxID=2805435 RepID=UPI002ABD68A0|nr:FAD:protein FMN transferase [Paraburkholderia sp. J67]